MTGRTASSATSSLPLHDFLHTTHCPEGLAHSRDVTEKSGEASKNVHIPQPFTKDFRFIIDE